jgi:hypothetical protein
VIRPAALVRRPKVARRNWGFAREYVGPLLKIEPWHGIGLSPPYFRLQSVEANQTAIGGASVRISASLSKSIQFRWLTQ